LTGQFSSAPFIMLAEDNPADVYLLQRSLKRHLENFELQVFDDGEKAIRFIEAVDADESVPSPAIVLADLNLPKKGGLEILQFVRQSRRLGRVPFVVLTSSDSPADRAETERCGATAYFCKPGNLSDFMAIGLVIRDALAAETA
jgi:CheY-like chemotaxis protein